MAFNSSKNKFSSSKFSSSNFAQSKMSNFGASRHEAMDSPLFNQPMMTQFAGSTPINNRPPFGSSINRPPITTFGSSTNRPSKVGFGSSNSSVASTSTITGMFQRFSMDEGQQEDDGYMPDPSIFGYISRKIKKNNACSRLNSEQSRSRCNSEQSRSRLNSQQSTNIDLS